jgi:SAM-dependent methyltransferase
MFLVLYLKVKLFFARYPELSDLHQRAIKSIPEFISQYPMHLYPVIAKSMELAFLKKNLEEGAWKVRGEIAELAIGEGTFSNRIFSEERALVGFDLNPYSLIHTWKYTQIRRRVVADCRNPPIDRCGASLIVCNNFLHHVTEKEKVLEAWAQIAPYALFNENTPYWSSGWAKPYLLNLVGLKKRAHEVSRDMELKSLQNLWDKERLISSIDRFYTMVEEGSFLSEKVFFLSTICSALLFCYGPPTPDLQKRIMNRILGPITRFLTYHMARVLIEYDAILPRDKDTFISWLVRSTVVCDDCPPEHVSLVCPDCRGSLRKNICTNCHNTFEEKDGMLFLLSRELMQEVPYVTLQQNLLGEEHL